MQCVRHSDSTENRIVIERLVMGEYSCFFVCYIVQILTNLYWVTKIVQYIRHQHSERNCYWEDGDGGKCVFVCEFVCVRRLFWYNFEVSLHQIHVITHLFLNANSVYNCWCYTRVACSVEHNTWYQNCTKSKGHLLSNYLLLFAHCELFTEGNGFWDGLYIYMYIMYLKSVAVYIW
jgi:hypothetical protein